MELYKLTASQLVSLLKILGALIADYASNPKKPMDASLRPLLANALSWKSLPNLKTAIDAALKGGDKVSALFELGNDLKSQIPVYFQNREFTTPELQLLKAMRSYLSTDSESALNYIRKNASILKDDVLATAFAPPQVKSDHTALRRIVRNLVGRDGTHLTIPESQMVKEVDPTNWARYAQLRKDHNADFKSSLMNYVRSQHKERVDYQTAYAEMVAKGFTHSMVPGFKGLIDDQGKWYTEEGDLINGVPNLSTYSHVSMNPKPGLETPWIFKSYKEDGSVAYGYTTKFMRDQASSKFEHVKDLTSVMNKVRSNWIKKLRDFDPSSEDCVAATVLEILFQFAARIGSAPGRGVGTLVCKQARETVQGINLAYLGKDSIPTKHVLKNSDPSQKLVIKALHQLLASKSGNDYIFTYTSGNRVVRCTPAYVNRAFKQFGAPSTVTIHKIRTFRGTSLFQELMQEDAKRRPPKDQKEALLRYKDLCAKVGKLLNHKRGVGTDTESVTGVTAAASYIDKSLQLDLFNTWGFRPPKSLETEVEE